MKRARGFANPDYLIALAVIVIVLAIVIPACFRARAARASYRNLEALRGLRAALGRYAAETKTPGPAQLSDLAKGGKYLAEIPSVEIVGLHPRSAQVRELGVTDDSGGWTYSNLPAGPRAGEVWINCTHTDSQGKAWNTY